MRRTGATLGSHHALRLVGRSGSDRSPLGGHGIGYRRDDERSYK